MKRAPLLLSLSCLFALSGCANLFSSSSSFDLSIEDNSSINNSSNEDSSITISSSIEELDPEIKRNYVDFYNPSSKIKLHIKLSNESAYRVCDYGKPDNKTKHDIYHPCTLEVDINGEKVTYEEVGIRMKGNTSRELGQFCFDDAGHINGEAHFKLAFNETFEDNDYYSPTSDTAILKKRRFGGTKKFDIKWNKNYDQKYLKEAYASYILEQEGLFAQKINLAEVTIETDVEQKTFIYSIMESIDSEFLTRRLSETESDGDLYKCSWQDGKNASFTDASSKGVEDASKGKYYAYDLKTNKKKSTHQDLDNFISTLNISDEGLSDNEVKEKIESLVDIDYFLKFSAMEYVISNPDSLRYNYNNTYLYFNSDSHKMYPIMYDNDRCFGIIKDWDARAWTRWPTSGKSIYGQQKNPLYFRTVCSSSSSRYHLINEYQDRFLDYVKEYYDKYISNEKYMAFTSRFATQDNVEDENISFATFASEIGEQIDSCLNNRKG